jgi:phosphate transport system substrate-binding protein
MRALLEGKADICAASRPISPEEVRSLAEKYHSIGLAHFICRDAIEIFLHPSNPVMSLQSGQVKAIFSGKITNWRQMGGENHSIQIYIRTESSGTRRYFAEHLLQDVDYSANAIEVETNAAMVEHIANDPSGIGYGGNAFTKGVKVCKLDAIAPVLEKVNENAYPFNRYLYFYTIHQTYGPIKEFIDWVISPDAQPLIEQSGYFPIWSPY